MGASLIATGPLTIEPLRPLSIALFPLNQPLYLLQHAQLEIIFKMDANTLCLAIHVHALVNRPHFASTVEKPRTGAKLICPQKWGRDHNCYDNIA